MTVATHGCAGLTRKERARFDEQNTEVLGLNAPSNRVAFINFGQN
jgi:hypothetical protein